MQDKTAKLVLSRSIQKTQNKLKFFYQEQDLRFIPLPSLQLFSILSYDKIWEMHIVFQDRCPICLFLLDHGRWRNGEQVTRKLLFLSWILYEIPQCVPSVRNRLGDMLDFKEHLDQDSWNQRHNLEGNSDTFSKNLQRNIFQFPSNILLQK